MIFWISKADFAILRGPRILERMLKRRAVVSLLQIDAGTSLNSTILWPLSLAKFVLKLKKIVKFVINPALIFYISDSTCDLTDVPASIYDRKTAARRFDIIDDLQRSLGLAQSFLKGRNASIWRKREQTLMILSDADGLAVFNFTLPYSPLLDKFWRI